MRPLTPRLSHLIVTSLALLPLVAHAAPGTEPPRPNILLILVDDMGEKSLSCFGSRVKTPNLDRLAANGMVFTNAHACPMCAPTRDEMLTGISRARLKGRPGKDVPFFTNHLAELGYATGMAGKWFVTSDNGNSELDPVREGVVRLPGRKGDPREGGTRVPLIAHWPDRIKAGSTCPHLVHVQDFGPTLLELAGGREGTAMMGTTDGLSFAPALSGEAGQTRDHIMGWGGHPSVWLERIQKELGKPDLAAYRLVWIRGTRFKLYNDGRLYDLETDWEESKRILPGKGSPDAEAFRKKMQGLPVMKAAK